MTKELQIEERFIKKLESLKYEYRPDIRNRDSLEKNFREKFEKLNHVSLTNAEFARLRDEVITNDVFKASQALRHKETFFREDGTPLQYSLVNNKDWCKNEFEVVNQLRMNTENSYHRYDVIILINGLPLVQIELKTLDVNPRRAMEQIVEYKNDPGNGYGNSLLCFMQLFIVSNESHTRYFANNHNKHFSFNADERFLPIYEWATDKNKKINNLTEFADHFLVKCTLGEMISRYMVLVASEQKLMMMRPYQIYAVQRIIKTIHNNSGNGYIWHTTGSGKTLTSFKASTLLKDNPDIEKCLFVVDRKDLDRQTREEFNKFQNNCVEENTNTETLVQRLLSEDKDDKVIVTTIQKLGLALDNNNKRNQAFKKGSKQTYRERLAPLSDKRIVFIFDECHRSQFGDNHQTIKSFFPKSQLFGFTGTPIKEKNSTFIERDGNQGYFKTTESLFENLLHSYTISNAIEDKNVLSFHIDYFGKNTSKSATNKKTSKDTPPIEAVIKEILEKHNQATDQRRFNAILATSSINDAINYVEQFRVIQLQQRQANDDFIPLNIACVFSPPAEGDKDVQQLQEDLITEQNDNKVNPEEKKQALRNIITDYNQQYGTNHTISEFDKYYQDVQERIKNQKYSNTDYPHKYKIDVVIVVDMLLTGFDSKYLNTLYADKNLKYHGLIQAFSRTNRVLNDTKPWGNILDFRGQEKQVDEAIELFSDSNKQHEKEIWLVEPAPVVVEKFEKAVKNLDNFMQSHGLACKPEEVANLQGDNSRAEFINYFKEVQRFKTQLEQYTDLTEDNKQAVETTLPQDAMRSFKNWYLHTAQELKAKQEKGEKGLSDKVQQLDFEFVLFASAVIDYDYIMALIAKSTQTTTKKKMTRAQIIELISSHANLMEEREDIIEYINSLVVGESLTERQIRQTYEAFKQNKATGELAIIAKKHGLSIQPLQLFVDEIVSRMIFDGEALTDLLAPLDLGWKGRRSKELELMEELTPLLKKQAKGHEISGLDAYV